MCMNRQHTSKGFDGELLSVLIQCYKPSVVYFTEANVDSYMLFNFHVHFNGKEKIQQENKYLRGCHIDATKWQ